MTNVNKPSSETRSSSHDTLGELASAADTAARDVMGEARSRVRHAVDAGRERVTEMRDTLEDRVVDRPLQSLVIAAAIGMFVGFLLHRRRG